MHFTWEKVAKRITDLIQKGRYLTEQEQAEYDKIQAEKALVEEDALIFLVCVRSFSLCVEVVDSYIFKLSCISSAAECLYKDFRGACNAAEMNMISGFDIFYSLIRTYEFNFLHIDYYCVSMLITILQKY